MFIKWKYNDHGHSDFKTVEIPDDLDGYESVEEYICDHGWVPTWSERFWAGRIKWEQVPITRELILKKLKGLKHEQQYTMAKIYETQGILKTLPKNDQRIPKRT